MGYRKFWLENADGNYFYLTENSRWFLADPEGLGLKINYTSIKLSDSEYINYKDYDLGSIDGDLLFIGKTNEQKYADYFSFMRFMSRPPIYLHYQTPNNNKSYRTLVQITGLEKTQVGKDGVMHCPLSLKRLTLWFSDEMNYIIAGNDVENGKDYPLKRPYSYGAISYKNIVCLNNGMVEAPFTIEVIGEVTDMQYTLSQNGVIYGKGKINGTYDYIFINSDDLNEEIRLQLNGSVIPNAVNYQDLTVGTPNEVYVTFLKLRAGQSALNFTLGNNFDGTVRIGWRNAYLSV